MMKKISYALLGSALLTSVAQAEDATAHAPMSASAPTSACNFSGFYMGLGLGYGVTKGKHHETYMAGGLSSTLNGEPTVMDGATGGIFAGYGKEMGASRVYLGLEAAYLLSGEKFTYKNDTLGLAYNHKKKDTLELAFRLGVAMNNALPYVKVGFASSKFELGTLDGSFKMVKDSKRANGFLVGAGIDLKVSRNVMAGLAYTYTTYKDVKSKTLHNGINPISPTDSLNIKNGKPTSHAAMLRIAYTF
ncbi:MAG: outer membrane protein [Alphaproteobacteria bacterium]